ncbi:MAG: TRAP transporter small permease [Bacillota bacterium]
MKLIHHLSNGLYKIEKLLAVIFCLIILISLSAGVLFRYVLSNPLTWSDETAIFSLVWLTFIGGSMSIKRKDAPAITLFIDRFSGVALKVLVVISTLAVLIFVGYLFYLSVVWLSSPNILIQKSSSMQMPMIYAYLSVPVSFLFMTIHALEVFLDALWNRKGEVY